jgi:WD40 repeat protein
MQKKLLLWGAVCRPTTLPRLAKMLIAVLVLQVAIADNSRGMGASEAHQLSVIKTIQLEGPVNAVAFSRDGQHLAVLSDFGRSLVGVSTTNFEINSRIQRLGGGYSGNSLAFVSGNSVITSTPVGDYGRDPRYAQSPLIDKQFPRNDIFALMEWDITRGKRVQYFPSPDRGVIPGIHYSDTFAVSRDGTLVAAIQTENVLVFNSATARIVQTITTDDQPVSVAFGRDDDLAVGTIAGNVVLVHARTGKTDHQFQAYPYADYSVHALAFSSDGAFLATGKYTNSDRRRINGKWVIRQHNPTIMKVWTASGQLVATLSEPPMLLGGDDAPNVYAVAWHGSTVAVGTSASLTVWKINSHQAIPIANRHLSNGAYTLSYSPRGMLAVGSGSEIFLTSETDGSFN